MRHLVWLWRCALEPTRAWMVHKLICDFLNTSLMSYNVELCVCWFSIKVLGFTVAVCSVVSQ